MFYILTVVTGEVVGRRVSTLHAYSLAQRLANELRERVIISREPDPLNLQLELHVGDRQPHGHKGKG